MSPASGRFLVVGGRQRPDALGRPEWERHERGLVLAVEPGVGVRPVLDYRSPPEAIPAGEDFAVLFKAGSFDGETLWLPTPTEILGLGWPGLERRCYLSLPSFNDLHHVRPTGRGTLLVVSTGLDLVQEIELGGRVVREWAALGGDPWARFSRQLDYRKVASTKPHPCHPNFVFEADGEVWVTRFEQRDVACLTRPERRIDIGVERPHDGIVVGRKVYFTTVDGRIVIADLDSDRVERVVDLNRVCGTDLALGWCRGLAVLDGEQVVVGFSRLRPTKLRENVRWVKHRLGLATRPGNLPCRVACIDLAAERLVWEENLELHGLAAVFSVHRLL